MDLTTLDTLGLIDIIKEQNIIISSLRNTIEGLNADSKILREQVDYLTKKLFGTKSEKTAALTGQIVLEGMEFGEFNEADVTANPKEVEPIITKKRTRKGYSREKALINLPEEDRVYTLSDEDKVCKIDGDTLHLAGKKYIRSEIEYIPATMRIIHVYEENWECRTCRKEGRNYLKRAKANTPVLQHSMASPSSVAWTMYQKYVNHVPLYRQEKDWLNLGMEIKRSTLSNWIVKTSEEILSKMALRLHKELLSDNYLHADETPIQVMNEDGKKNTAKSYMWVYTTGANSKRKIRLFKYSPGRAGENAADFLEGYTGFLHTDAYKGYGKLKDVTRCLCWSHARRYFADALPKDIKSTDAMLPKEGLAYCNKLFEIEEKLKGLSPEERKEQRLKLEAPLLKAFWSWVDLNVNTVLSKSKIGKALQYVKNQESGLMAYLKDGNCEISNNLAENSIRPFTVGRKNWLFAGSPNGAEASATVYSIVETAKANNLNPYKYLKLLLMALPQDQFQSDSKMIDSLLPWDPKVQEACKIE